jgi:hypothetical protein
VTTATDLPEGLGADYAQDADHRPLAGYSGLSAGFGVALAGALAATHWNGRELPERLSVQDLVLVGIATHKISRLLAKDKVTSFIRAPFTRFQEKTGQGELKRRREAVVSSTRAVSCSSAPTAWHSGSRAASPSATSTRHAQRAYSPAYGRSTPLLTALNSPTAPRNSARDDLCPGHQGVGDPSLENRPS